MSRTLEEQEKGGAHPGHIRAHPPHLQEHSDKMLPRIEHFGGHVIQTSLSNEEEQRLRTALGE